MKLELRVEGYQTLDTPDKTVPKVPVKEVSPEVKGDKNELRKDDKK